MAYQEVTFPLRPPIALSSAMQIPVRVIKDEQGVLQRPVSSLQQNGELTTLENLLEICEPYLLSGL